MSNRKQGMWFKIKIILISILLCIAFFAGAFTALKISNKSDFTEQNNQVITSEFIGAKIQEIAELSTLQHHYRKISNYQDVKKLISYFPDWRINKSIKEFMLIYEGDVKMGYDLRDIKINVDTATMAIDITLPDPKILSHSIDFESISIICENKGWFNDIKFEDFKKFFLDEQKKYESANHDMLKKRAREQAERIITFYLKSIINIVKPESEAAKPSENPPTPQAGFKTWVHPEDSYKLNIK